MRRATPGAKARFSSRKAIETQDPTTPAGKAERRLAAGQAALTTTNNNQQEQEHTMKHTPAYELDEDAERRRTRIIGLVLATAANLIMFTAINIFIWSKIGWMFD